ncbi:MAG: glycosyltransferase family 1 protein, partial [Mesorhizobium sp.]
HSTDDVVAALGLSDAELEALRRQARERVLDEHTSTRRAAELDGILNEAVRAQASEPIKEAV